MGRVAKTREQQRAEWAREPLGPGRLRPTEGERPLRLDPVEKMTAVVERFCEGFPVHEILAQMEERFGDAGKMTREYAHSLIRRAANEGWLRYEPPPHRRYDQFLRDHYPWLADVRVVHSAVMRDVARSAAEVVLDLLKEHAGKPEVHVGLAGGYSLRQLTSALARLLCNPIPYKDLPRTVYFHSLVAGFDFSDPTTDPMTFFTFFVDEPALRITPRFVGLRAPAIVRTRDLEKLRAVDGIAAAFEAARTMDIILTSGADWSDEHSQLRRLMAHDPKSLEKLQKAGCVGDLLWRPIGPDGPIEVRTNIRAFTLFELSEIPELIDGGTRVVLMLGPCGACRQPKGELLTTMLGYGQPLATHVITDSRTAGELVMAHPDPLVDGSQ